VLVTKKQSEQIKIDQEDRVEIQVLNNVLI
jgi:hypothetical protein